MSFYKYNRANSQNDIIFLSSSKDSFPYKMYSDMRIEFWRHQINLQIKKSNRKSFIINLTSGNDSNAYNNSSLSTTYAMDHNSDSSSTLNDNHMKINKKHHQDLLNTSENNEASNQESGGNHVLKNLSGQGIPLNVEMTTKFNKDMKVLFEQDSKDENLVNIKVGGTFTGSMVGTSSMPQETFLSLIHDNLKDHAKTSNKIPKMVVKPLVEDQPVEKEKPPDNKKEQQSVASEESVSYFASSKPVQPVVKDPTLSIKSKTSQEATKALEVTNLKTDESISSFIKSNVSVNTQGKYLEPHTANSRMPSLSHYSSITMMSKSPAVLPTCIIRRIVRAMIAELDLPKHKVHKPNKLEAKVQSLTDDIEILNKNWHGALKRGKVMIGELIELILSVNIDHNTKSSEVIKPVLMELKTEFIECCIFLSKLTEPSKLKEHICLELIIDQMTEEINRLLQLFNEWIKSNKKMDFSAYFVKDFTQTLSPNMSEITTTTDTVTTTPSEASLSQSQVKIDSVTVGNNQTLKNNKSDEKPQEKKDETETKSKLSDKSKSPEQKMTTSTPTHFQDPSIITNSRMKKTMNTISQSAIEQNIATKSLPQESRNKMIALEVVDDQLVLKRNPETSLIKELSNQTELWKTPINAGRNSIKDLIEFIINTIIHEKETTKSLYLDVVKELEVLGKELLKSVANNLHDSRISNNDLHSLCYEILAEIIVEEISVATYIFNSLEPIGVENMMLGKLYRNYTAEKSENRVPSKISSNMGHPIADSYAHLTSEIMNYDETNKSQSITKSKIDVEKSASEQTSGVTSKSSVQQSVPIQPHRSFDTQKSDLNSLNSKKSSEPSTTNQKMLEKQTQESDPNKSNKNTLAPNESSTDMQSTDTEIKKESSFHLQVKKSNNSNEKPGFEEGHNQLLEILNKLNNQTSEINKIKETLHILSNNVDEKLSNWTCKFVAPYDDKYPIQSLEKKAPINFAKTTKLYNTQEVVPPPTDLLLNVQPSEHKSDLETVAMAKKVENKSFIAPISSQTTEEPVKARLSNTISFAEKPIDIDVLKLIGDGACHLLTSRQISANKPTAIRKQDSCENFNSEFDRIFEWVIEKYQETLESMMANSASKKIIEAMQTATMDERRKIERELINRIIEQNNLLINTWVKDICFHKVLDCLS